MPAAPREARASRPGARRVRPPAIAGRSAPYTFELTGGRLCLDFANTVGDRGTRAPIDHLATYGDLLAWARQTRVLTPALVRRLARQARRHPASARRALARARTLRDALYRIVAAVADRSSPAAADLRTLNAAVSGALAASRLVRRRSALAWDLPIDARDLTAMLPRVVRSALDVLTSADARRLRVCADRTCRWVFVDETKNGARRWCDMQVCGNRNKVRRFRRRGRRRPVERRRAAATPVGSRGSAAGGRNGVR